jgi:23S rRNA pseudouridine1911/1915/1917 synthase
LPAAALEFPRQALHAARLALIHPGTGEALAWESALPGDICALIASLKNAQAA